MTVFQEMILESILPIQIKWSWFHSFQKTMFYLTKSKYALFSNIKNENRAFRFFGTPCIIVIITMITRVVVIAIRQSHTFVHIVTELGWKGNLTRVAIFFLFPSWPNQMGLLNYREKNVVLRFTVIFQSCEQVISIQIPSSLQYFWDTLGDFKYGIISWCWC